MPTDRVMGSGMTLQNEHPVAPAVHQSADTLDDPRVSKRTRERLIRAIDANVAKLKRGEPISRSGADYLQRCLRDYRVELERVAA